MVTFTDPTASDSGDASVTTSVCSPASGSTFALGTTTVTCTATDIVDGAFMATSTGTVNTAVAGTYIVTYNATDTRNNVATPVQRTVTVEDSSFTLATSTNPDTTISGTLGTQSTTTATTGGVTATFSIAAGTTVTGTSTWNGVVNFPTVSMVYTGPTAPSGFTDSVTSAIEIGSSTSSLTFDKGLRILFSGQAGNHVGWSVGGTFTEITSSCSADNQTVGDALAAGADCKIDSGSDLVVWTKHFTTFITYTQTTNSTGGGGGGGGGGNGAPVGGGGGGGGTVAVALANNGGAAPGTTGTGTGTGTGSTGQVLGASTYNFQANLTLGARGNDVTELQKALIAAGFSIPAGATGYFGSQTKAAVIKYQAAHGISPLSGFVGPLTRAELNKGTTPTMSEEQRALLIQSLQAQVAALLKQIQAMQGN